MEAVIANTVESGDTIVIGYNGYWGIRMLDIAERYGGPCSVSLPGL